MQSVYMDFIVAVEHSSEQYINYIECTQQQQQTYNKMKNISTRIDCELKNLYDSI